MNENSTSALEQDPTTQPSAPQGADPEIKKRNTLIRQQMDACKSYRRKLVALWTTNLDYRRGKPFASQTDEDRVVVPLDWTYTKAKEAVLYSQTPRVFVDHPPETLAQPWFHTYETKVNDTLMSAGIEASMREVIPDVINAAGIGGIIVSYDTISEDVQVPAIDLSMLGPAAEAILAAGQMPDGTPVPMQTITRVRDRRYSITRVSPTDLLWPINFAGSNFNKAPWIGRSGRLPWPEAKSTYKLSEADKQDVVGDTRTSMDKMTHDVDKDKIAGWEEVNFDEIYYWEHQLNPDATSFSTIHRLVFLTGKDEPVVDEAWQGQRVDPQSGVVLGAQKPPLQLLTLSYLSDESIPPSDSSMGRPQVDEINKIRTQMILQRARALPMRWADVNRVDPMILQSLMRGTWQNIIPVQGMGSNAIGEIARASYPPEDGTFNQIAKEDLANTWQVGPNQTSSYGSGRHSAAEANNVESAFQTRVARERALVASFLCSIAEVLGGLLSICEDPSFFGQGFDPAIAKTLAYSIIADSTVLLDSRQRIERLKEFVDFTAKSGWLNLEPVLKELATLYGLDPNTTIQAPQPPPPAQPNISLRLTGTEDLINPLTLAMLMNSGQAPSSDLVEKAKQLIMTSVTPPAGMEGQAMPWQALQQQAALNGPLGPQAQGQVPVVGPDGQPLPPPPIPTPMPTESVQPPSPPPPAVGDANPGWEMNSRLNKREGPGDGHGKGGT